MGPSNERGGLTWLGGMKGLGLLILFVVLSEKILGWIGGDFGGMTWVAVHFGLNPFLCLIHAAVSWLQGWRARGAGHRLEGWIAGIASICLGIVMISGDHRWVQFLGIRF